MKSNNAKRTSDKERETRIKGCGEMSGLKRGGRSIASAWFVPTWDSRRVEERIGSAGLEGTSGVGTCLSA